MTIAARLFVFRCDLIDKWNPTGCPVTDQFDSWNAAVAAGWTGSRANSRCPDHRLGGQPGEPNE